MNPRFGNRKSRFLIVLFLLCNQSFADEDLYNILGVRRTASTKEIKQAYKNMAKEW
jgi:DnaJ-domain-containing protein 1